MRVILFLGLLALACVTVSEAKDTKKEVKLGFGTLSKSVRRLLTLKKKEPPSLDKQWDENEVQLGHDESQNTLGRGKSQMDLERHSTLRNLFGNKGSSRKPIPNYEPPTEQKVKIFSEIASDEEKPIPSFLTALWEARKDKPYEQGAFRLSAATLTRQKLIDKINDAPKGHVFTKEEFANEEATTLENLLKQYLSQETPLDKPTREGLLPGVEKLTTHAKVADIIMATSLEAPTQRAYIGKFYVGIAQHMLKHSETTMMGLEGIGVVFKNLFQQHIADNANDMKQVMEAMTNAKKIPALVETLVSGYGAHKAPEQQLSL